MDGCWLMGIAWNGLSSSRRPFCHNAPWGEGKKKRDVLLIWNFPIICIFCFMDITSEQMSTIRLAPSCKLHQIPNLAPSAVQATFNVSYESLTPSIYALLIVILFKLKNELWGLTAGRSSLSERFMCNVISFTNSSFIFDLLWILISTLNLLNCCVGEECGKHLCFTFKD